MVSVNTIGAREEFARRLRASAAETRVNVGEVERTASKIGGGVLLAAGLMKGGLKGLLMAGLGGALLYRGSTGHCPVYEALGADTSDAEPGPMSSVRAQRGVRVEDSVTITGPSPQEVYTFWRDYANLARFMGQVVSVTDLGGGRSHWIVTGPLGTTLEYDAQIHNEVPGSLIAWRSIGEGDLDTAGTVTFETAPGHRGTIVRINQKFDPPGGRLGVAIARWLGADPQAVTRENLRRLKQLFESGELAPAVEPV